jgi:hypothetical protein
MSKRRRNKTDGDASQGEAALWTNARDLLGMPMLIFAVRWDWDDKYKKEILSVFFRLENGGQAYCFHGGNVVAKQIAETFLPTWATMRMVAGKQHDYYILDVAKIDKIEWSTGETVSASDALPTPANLCKQKPKTTPP